eukprot:TRINITY_DN2833_c0_g1_i1.p1 TRINITY_DN2833_c0_g1~~TRINITY_DN2833_c0_g1_i1.p1  ORF type:complete len:290 (+),score=58.65 TRINITY_DN2833_c0_g1_i1:49-918(+)
MCGKCPDSHNEQNDEESKKVVEKEEEKVNEVVEEKVVIPPVKEQEEVKPEPVTITTKAVEKIREEQMLQSRFRIPLPSQCAGCTGLLVCVFLWFVFWYISHRIASRRRDDTAPAPPRRVAIRHEYDVAETTAKGLKEMSQSAAYSKYLKEKEVIIAKEVDEISRKCRDIAFTAGTVYLAICYYYIQPTRTLKSMSNFILLLGAIPYFLPMLGQPCGGMFWSSFLSMMALGYGTNATKAIGQGCLYAVTASALFLPVLACYQDALQKRRLNYLKMLQNPTQKLSSTCGCC